MRPQDQLDSKKDESNPVLKPTLAQLDAWTSDIAAFLKQEDPNHLIMDGRCVREGAKTGTH
jgi:hypothetical protein